MLASPGSYFFLSNSAGQGDEWLKSLNKSGVWIPFTGKQNEPFGILFFLELVRNVLQPLLSNFYRPFLLGLHNEKVKEPKKDLRY